MENPNTQGIDIDRMRGEFGDTKASLAFSNMLREGLFTQETGAQVPMEDEEQMQEDPMAFEVEEETAAEEPVAKEEVIEEEPEIEDPKEDMDAKIGSLRDEMRAMIAEEIGGLKQIIKEALNEEEGQT